MKYIPKPKDTSDVKLSDEILALVEQLAQNTHEVWAQGRVAEGWSYGEKLDGNKKSHPCLIDYEKLPESEKQYDRNTAEETLKMILSLGYKITK